MSPPPKKKEKRKKVCCPSSEWTKQIIKAILPANLQTPVSLLSERLGSTQAQQTKESVGVNGIGEAFEPYQNWHIQTPAPGVISLSGDFQVC